MKQFLTLSALFFFAYTAQAQSMNNSSSDTTHRRFHHGWAGHNGRDSLHKKNFRGFEGRGEAMNRINSRSGYERNGFRSFRNHRGFGNEMARLHFSPEQRKQMMNINKEYRQKQSDLYKNNSMTLGEYKSKLLALQKEKKNKLQSLLTPEQKNQIAVWKKRREENAQVMAAAHLERMKIRLNLTDAQTAAIKAQQASTKKQMEAIHQNENMTREEKTEQMKALIAKNKENMKSVLSPEQYSQYESMHNKFRGRSESR